MVLHLKMMINHLIRQMLLNRDGMKTMLPKISPKFSTIVSGFLFFFEKAFEKVENYSFSEYYLNSMSGFKKQCSTLFEHVFLLLEKFPEKIIGGKQK